MGHTGTFGFHIDKERNMYFVNSTSAYRKPWNKDPEQLASGMRNAMAVGASQEQGVAEYLETASAWPRSRVSRCLGKRRETLCHRRPQPTVVETVQHASDGSP